MKLLNTVLEPLYLHCLHQHVAKLMTPYSNEHKNTQHLQTWDNVDFIYIKLVLTILFIIDCVTE